jgi:capsular polysaccharide transport system permease protein
MSSEKPTVDAVESPLKDNRPAGVRQSGPRRHKRARRKRPRGKEDPPQPIALIADGPTEIVQPLPRLEPPPPPLSAAAAPIFPVDSPPSQTPGDPTRTRHRFRSALFFVIIPTLLSALYFGIIAASQFYAKADFAIRTQNSSATEGMSIRGLGIASGSPAVADMFIVKSYIHSRQILEDLKDRLDLRKVYDTPHADLLARLPADATEEELLSYWKRMTTVKYDATTGITHLGVRAFTPEDAKVVAEHVLRLSEELVNRISARAQQDAVALAQTEVDKAYERVAQTMDRLRSFQQESKQVDPESFVLARSEIHAKLETEISQYESKLQELLRALPSDAPSVVQLSKRLEIARQQLAAEQLRSTESMSHDGRSASEVITKFNKLKLDTEFAAKAYDSALASLESARSQAASQTRYLEAFVRPQTPQKAEYPWRVVNIALVALGTSILWGIGTLVVSAIKEHL